MKPSRPVSWVLASTHHGCMLVNRQDYQLVGDGGYGVGYQILNSSAHDQPEIDAALSLLSLRHRHFGDGVVALDCGANIGVHCIEWARHMHGWGEVIAIEAQERIFYALAGNIALNNCANARALWAAVGAHSGTIAVPVPDYAMPANFGGLELRERTQSEFIGQEISRDLSRCSETRLLTIDELDLSRLDFLKIDIEGMEMEALRGAAETLRRCRPQLIVERIKSDQQELHSCLEGLGYRCMVVGINLIAIHLDDPGLSQVQVVQRTPPAA